MYGIQSTGITQKVHELCVVGRQAHGYYTSPSVPSGWQIAMASHKKSFSSVLLVENHGIAHKVLQFSCVGRVQCYWYETIIQCPLVPYGRQRCKGITEQVLQFCVAGRVPKLPHFKAKCSLSRKVTIHTLPCSLVVDR